MEKEKKIVYYVDIRKYLSILWNFIKALGTILKNLFELSESVLT